MMEPGAYCAIVTLEWMKGGTIARTTQSFMFLTQASQTRTEMTQWVFEEATSRAREGASDYERSRLNGEPNIIFLSIEPD